MEQNKDLYDILEISNKEADQDEINEAFHKKINQLEQTGATEETKTEVCDAHAILIDPAKREIYELGLGHGYGAGYMITEDLYDKLRVNRDANTRQINGAYSYIYMIESRTGAPERRIREIAFAHKILKDNDKRRIYDIGWKHGASEEY